MQSRQDFQSAPRRNRQAVITTAGIRVFTFDGQGIRCIETNGERRFAPVDIYRCLGLADPVASARFFLRAAESIRADAWPYVGQKPRVIDANGVLDLLDRVRGERKSRADVMREWFLTSVLHRPGHAASTGTVLGLAGPLHQADGCPNVAARPSGRACAAASARMADIADRLDPDVQAALRDAFRAIQGVSVRLSVALDRGPT